jgi:hypothetical protein
MEDKRFQECVFIILCTICAPILVVCLFIDTIRSFVSISSRLTIYEATETTLDFIYWLATEIDDLRKTIWKALKDIVQNMR